MTNDGRATTTGAIDRRPSPSPSAHVHDIEGAPSPPSTLVVHPNGSHAPTDASPRDDGSPLPAPSPQPPVRHGPIPSLDGLRALAVLIVVVSHSGYGETIPGGLGVTVFFFLSGYLITTLILDEQDSTSSVNIKHFYLRRAFRLLPPLVITLLVAYSLVAAGLLDGGISVQGVMSQLFYFANYFTIFFADESSQPAGTGILWSLAVEEHFYILFPLLIYVAFRFRNARQLLIRLFIVLCVAALAWRLWVISRPGFEEIRTYYATDTRFDSILFGCLLALWRNPARTPVDPRRSVMRGGDLLLCGMAVALLLSTIVYRNPDFRESLRYSLQGLALMPIFYYAVRYPTTGPFRLLNTRLLARIGVLSYGIYLIHDVVLHTLPSSTELNIPSWGRLSIAVAASVGFAALLDRYVDPYFRRRRAALH
jgi:peptidoglycan/LPS O-acetylase OafA/YrhL